MSNTAKPTPGPWKRDESYKNVVITEALVVGDIVCLSPEEIGYEDSAKNWEANAALIIEAGTVYHETGRTPRQLADERDDAIKALAGILSIYDNDDEKVNDHRIAAARAIIAKVEKA
jgi:hypothetical protein